MLYLRIFQHLSFCEKVRWAVADSTLCSVCAILSPTPSSYRNQPVTLYHDVLPSKYLSAG